jgi:hypothetical protein
MCTRLQAPAAFTSAPTSKHAHSTPTPGNPAPMDIDAARKKRTSDASCYRCGKPGHWSKDCPDWYNVRLLSDDELQKIMSIRLARLDVAVVDLEPLEEGNTAEEGFPPDNE